MADTGGRERSLIIIGAGIAGLSAGAYARMNGYRTQLFEMGGLPGGVCTSWQRGDYTIDGCIAWLVGSAPGGSLHRMWQELGALQDRRIVDPDEFMRLEGLDGHLLVFHTDLDRLQQHLIELAPEDEGLIRRMVGAARACAHLEIPLEVSGLSGAAQLLRLLGPTAALLKNAREWLGLSIGDWAARFKSPLLREGLLQLFPSEFSVFFALFTLGVLHARNAGYPIGGSLAFARAIEARYRELGGEVHYGARVSRILVENDRAVGVRLADGTEHRADAVISAADGHTTLFELLEGRYVDERLRRYYRLLSPFPPLIHVALGVRRTFEDVPHSVQGLSFPLRQPIRIAGQELRRLTVLPYNHDPTLAPAGRTMLKVLLSSDFAWWAALREFPEQYAGEKERIADLVTSALETRFPGLASRVEMRDVATPITYERYTGNWRGAFEGWVPTPRTLLLRIPTTLPGLEGFSMAGQWVVPGGGLPTVGISGRQAIRSLCERDGRRFVALLPGERPAPARAAPRKVLRPVEAVPSPR